MKSLETLGARMLVVRTFGAVAGSYQFVPVDDERRLSDSDLLSRMG